MNETVSFKIFKVRMRYILKLIDNFDCTQTNNNDKQNIGVGCAKC